TGIFVFFLIAAFFLFVIGGLLMKTTDSKPKVSKQSILELKLYSPLKDYGGKTRFKDYTFLDEDNKDGRFNLISSIDYAATDDNIERIIIEILPFQAGSTQLKNLREALKRFKESVKFVTAYGNVYSQSDYYLSAV